MPNPMETIEIGDNSSMLALQSVIDILQRSRIMPERRIGISLKHGISVGRNYSCDNQVFWESACAFFRATTRFRRQVTQLRRSWYGGKMLAFQHRGFVFEPVRMR